MTTLIPHGLLSHATGGMPTPARMALTRPKLLLNTAAKKIATATIEVTLGRNSAIR